MVAEAGGLIRLRNASARQEAEAWERLAVRKDRLVHPPQ